MDCVLDDDDLFLFIMDKLDLRDLCISKCVNCRFKKICEKLDNNKYINDIFTPFTVLKENVYSLILNNINYFTLYDNALIFCEFIEIVLLKYDLVLIRDKNMVTKISDLLNLLGPYCNQTIHEDMTRLISNYQ